ncbi:MAG: hypothetical protein WC548_02725 [Candidatus Pacearchaeota archaeon]
MPIKTPDILPGEDGYISRKERTKEKKLSEKKEKKITEKKDIEIGKIKTGYKGYRIGRPTTTPRKEKKYIIWRFSKKIGEIIVSNEGKIILKFFRFGGVGNYKSLIQDIDFQRRWAIREQELLLTQKECAICNSKISRSAKPNLYHTKMWLKRAQLLEEAEKVPQEVIEGKLTIEDGWKKFNEILEEGNRYYMSLQDTALICASCAKKKGLSY